MPNDDSSELVCKRNVEALLLVTRGLSAMDTVALGTAKLSSPSHTHGQLTERVKSMLNQITIQLC